MEILFDFFDPVLLAIAIGALIVYVAFPSGLTGFLFGVLFSGPILWGITYAALAMTAASGNEFAFKYGSEIAIGVFVLTVFCSAATGAKRGNKRLASAIRRHTT